MTDWSKALEEATPEQQIWPVTELVVEDEFRGRSFVKCPRCPSRTTITNQVERFPVQKCEFCGCVFRFPVGTFSVEAQNVEPALVREFKVGDVVRLKIGGARMLVSDVHHGPGRGAPIERVWCKWHSANGRGCCEFYSPEWLVLDV